jgi:hypothetical protein
MRTFAGPERMVTLTIYCVQWQELWKLLWPLARGLLATLASIQSRDIIALITRPLSAKDNRGSGCLAQALLPKLYPLRGTVMLYSWNNAGRVFGIIRLTSETFCFEVRA